MGGGAVRGAADLAGFLSWREPPLSCGGGREVLVTLPPLAACPRGRQLESAIHGL